ncbi:hypothetical protein GGI43DRAFT_401264, partial [Trichoderma evansii]
MQSTHPSIMPNDSRQYSLLHDSAYGNKEDWSATKDPKEKKRMQNRIAQRGYRKRLKARLETLQSKVDHHERMELQFVREDGNASKNGVLNTRNNHAPTLVTTVEPLKSKLPQQSPRLHLVQPNYYADTSDENSRNIFDPRTMAVLNNQTSAQSLPRPLQLLPDQTDTQRNVPEKLFLDYARIAKSTEEKLDSEQEDTACLNIELQREDVPTDLRSVGRAEQTAHSHLFTPEGSGSMEFDFNHPPDVWKNVMFTPTSPHTTHSFESLSSARQHNTSATANKTNTRGSASPSDISADNTSLDENLLFILECADSLGFDNFDSLVTTYYNERFYESSLLASEQRLSRNRRLPKVLAEIFHAAGNWSDLEQRGLREEILNQTESMLILEGNGAFDTLQASINHLLLLNAQSEVNSTSTTQTILGVKRTIRNQVPNLWSLMLALASENRALRKEDRSNTVLAVIILLECSGYMPIDQLHKLLGMCLIN